MSIDAGSPWRAAGVGTSSGETVNLVEGTTFMVAASSGVIGSGPSHGLFLLDTRVLSRWELSIDGFQLEGLAFVPNGPFSGTFVSRAETGAEIDAPIVVLQRRHLGQGMREDVEIRNHGGPCALRLRLQVATDLAGLFEVKSNSVPARLPVHAKALRSGLRLEGAETVGDVEERTPTEIAQYELFRSVEIVASMPPRLIDPEAGVMEWSLDLGAYECWSLCLEVSTDAAPPSHRCGAAIEEAIPAERFRRWRAATPDLRSGLASLDAMVQRSIDDLGALRIFDPDHAERVVVAAGAPWFMALFGRDSLIASWMALAFDQELAHGVLAELADKQGTRLDPATEEQPGRILHEVRLDRLSRRLLGRRGVYYGTIDATPLFVMLVGELARWTGVTERIARLLPAVDRALQWVDEYGDRDGDGFVEYERLHPHGLEHQGWKDSWDAIRHADGSLARPPIALCEVQGYVYAAWRSRARLAMAFGEPAAVIAAHEARAERLAAAFDERFWMDDLGWYAVGLDADKKQIAALTSNIGHLLWTGIVPPERAARVAERLVAPDMFTGWGVRTLSADTPGYNPLSYHCGSVWPHDTALAVGGLSRYGLDGAANLLADALIDAATANGLQLPELFGGFARTDIGVPVPYPTSCAPQAWASAVPLYLVRVMLGLEPDVPARRLAVRARLPERIGFLSLAGTTIGGESVRIDVSADAVRLSSMSGRSLGSLDIVVR